MNINISQDKAARVNKAVFRPCVGARRVPRYPRQLRFSVSTQAVAEDVSASSSKLDLDVKETILFQGFGWDSCREPGYWNRMKDMAPRIAEAGFTHVWLPPPSQSVSDEGYLPSQLYNFNSKFGSEEELRACVKAFRDVGVSCVADIVINHRCGDVQDEHGNWNTYSDACEPEGVPTCAWGPWAITNNDPEFRGQGKQDTGEDYHAAPDIDHTNEAVQKGFCGWIKYLVENIGYNGLRFDFSKGYEGYYTGLYSRETIGGDKFAVGEYWKDLAYEHDGRLQYNQDSSRHVVMSWLKDAGDSVTAFDFTLKGVLQEAMRYNQYYRLIDENGKPPGLLGWVPERTVTFLDNHDTGSSQSHWPFPRMKKMEGYAYILTHPGMPSVFFEHMYADSEGLRKGIESLLKTRKRNGIRADSKLKILVAKQDVYVADVTGTKGLIRVKVGPGMDMEGHAPQDDQGWKCVSVGDGFCVWEKPC